MVDLGKRLWLSILVLSTVLYGCGGASRGAAAESKMVDTAACETAASSVIEEADIHGPASYGSYTYTGRKDGLNTDGLTYFTFTQSTVNHTDETGEEIFLESITQTGFRAQCPIQNRWVNDVLEDLQNSDKRYGQDLLEYAKQDKKEGEEDFYCYSQHITRGVARHDNHVISLITRSSIYSGGTHPNLSQRALNLDMRELRTLTLEDVIVAGGCEELRELVIQRLEEKFSTLGESGLFANYRDIVVESLTYGKMTPYWYFNHSGLVIFFNPYTLAPYAAGIVKVELEYDALEGILENSYFREEINGWITDISLDQKQINAENTYDVNLGEGEKVYITLNGTATSVQLSEVTFVEKTAVASTMLFSANQLNDETTLALTGAADPKKTYVATYYDEVGGPKILYFRDNQMVTDIID